MKNVLNARAISTITMLFSYWKLQSYPENRYSKSTAEHESKKFHVNAVTKRVTFSSQLRSNIKSFFILWFVSSHTVKSCFHLSGDVLLNFNLTFAPPRFFAENSTHLYCLKIKLRISLCFGRIVSILIWWAWHVKITYWLVKYILHHNFSFQSGVDDSGENVINLVKAFRIIHVLEGHIFWSDDQKICPFFNQ